MLRQIVFLLAYSPEGHSPSWRRPRWQLERHITAGISSLISLQQTREPEDEQEVEQG